MIYVTTGVEFMIYKITWVFLMVLQVTSTIHGLLLLNEFLWHVLCNHAYVESHGTSRVALSAILNRYL